MHPRHWRVPRPLPTNTLWLVHRAKTAIAHFNFNGGRNNPWKNMFTRVSVKKWALNHRPVVGGGSSGRHCSRPWRGRVWHHAPLLMCWEKGADNGSRAIAALITIQSLSLLPGFPSGQESLEPLRGQNLWRHHLIQESIRVFSSFYILGFPRNHLHHPNRSVKQ